MADRVEVDGTAVRALANLAGLPLEEGREDLIAPQLSEWLTQANELSRKMSRPEYLTVTPVTVFSHPEVKEEAE